MPKNNLGLKLRFSNLKRKVSKGFIDPLSLFSIGFLVISLFVGVFALSKSGLKFDIREKATSCVVGTCCSNGKKCINEYAGPAEIIGTSCNGASCSVSSSGDSSAVTPYCNKNCSVYEKCVKTTSGGRCEALPTTVAVVTPYCNKSCSIYEKCVADTSGGKCEVQETQNTEPKPKPEPTPYCNKSCSIYEKCVADTSGGRCEIRKEQFSPIQIICNSGEKRCSGNIVQSCNLNQTGWLNSKDCGLLGCNSATKACNTEQKTIADLYTLEEKRNEALDQRIQDIIEGKLSPTAKCEVSSSYGVCGTGGCKGTEKPLNYTSSDCSKGVSCVYSSTCIQKPLAVTGTSKVSGSSEGKICFPFCNCSGTKGCLIGGSKSCTPPASCTDKSLVEDVQLSGFDPSVFFGKGKGENKVTDWLNISNWFKKSTSETDTEPEDREQIEEEVALAEKTYSPRCSTSRLIGCTYGCIPTVGGGKCNEKSSYVSIASDITEIVTKEDIETKAQITIEDLMDGNKYCSGNYKPGAITTWGGAVQLCTGGEDGWENISAYGYGCDAINTGPSWLAGSKTCQALDNLALTINAEFNSDGTLKRVIEPAKEYWCNTDSGGVPVGTVSQGGTDGGGDLKSNRSVCVSDPKHPDRGTWVNCSSNTDSPNYCALTIVPSWYDKEELKNELIAYSNITQSISLQFNQEYKNCLNTTKENCLEIVQNSLINQGKNKNIVIGIKEDIGAQNTLYSEYFPVYEKYVEKCAKDSSILECIDLKAYLNKTLAQTGVGQYYNIESANENFASYLYDKTANNYFQLNTEYQNNCTKDRDLFTDNQYKECFGIGGIKEQVTKITSSNVYKYFEARANLDSCSESSECFYWASQVASLEREDSIKMLLTQTNANTKYQSISSYLPALTQGNSQQQEEYSNLIQAAITNNYNELKDECSKKYGVSLCSRDRLKQFGNDLLTEVYDALKESDPILYAKITNQLNIYAPVEKCSYVAGRGSTGTWASCKCSEGFYNNSGLCLPKTGTTITSKLSEAEKDTLLANIVKNQLICNSQNEGTYQSSTGLCVREVVGEKPNIIVLGRDVKNSSECSYSEEFDMATQKCKIKEKEAVKLVVGTRGNCAEGYRNAVTISDTCAPELSGESDNLWNRFLADNVAQNSTISSIGSKIAKGTASFFDESLKSACTNSTKSGKELNWIDCENFTTTGLLTLNNGNLITSDEVKYGITTEKPWGENTDKVVNNWMAQSIYDLADTSSNIKGLNPQEYHDENFIVDVEKLKKDGFYDAVLEHTNALIQAQSKETAFGGFLRNFFNPGYVDSEQVLAVGYSWQDAYNKQLDGTFRPVVNYNPLFVVDDNNEKYKASDKSTPTTVSSIFESILKTVVGKDLAHIWYKSITGNSNPNNIEYQRDLIVGDGSNSLKSAFSRLGVPFDPAIDSYQSWVTNNQDQIDQDKEGLFTISSIQVFNYLETSRENPGYVIAPIAQNTVSVVAGVLSNIFLQGNVHVSVAVQVAADVVTQWVVDQSTYTVFERINDAVQLAASEGEISTSLAENSLNALDDYKRQEYITNIGTSLVFNAVGEFIGRGIADNLLATSLTKNNEVAQALSKGLFVNNADEISQEIIESTSKFIGITDKGGFLTFLTKEQAQEAAKFSNIVKIVLIDSQIEQSSKEIAEAAIRKLSNSLFSVSPKEATEEVAESLNRNISKQTSDAFLSLAEPKNYISQGGKTPGRIWVENLINRNKSVPEAIENLGVRNIKYTDILDLKNGEVLDVTKAAKDGLIIRLYDRATNKIIFNDLASNLPDNIKLGSNILVQISDTPLTKGIEESLSATTLRNFSEIISIQRPNYIRAVNGVILSSFEDSFEGLSFGAKNKGLLVDIVTDGKVQKGIINSAGEVEKLDIFSSLLSRISRNSASLIDPDTGEITLKNVFQSRGSTQGKILADLQSHLEDLQKTSFKASNIDEVFGDMKGSGKVKYITSNGQIKIDSFNSIDDLNNLKKSLNKQQTIWFETGDGEEKTIRMFVSDGAGTSSYHERILPKIDEIDGGFRLSADGASGKLFDDINEFNKIIADFEESSPKAGFKLRREQIEILTAPETIRQLQAGGGKTSVVGPILAAMEKNTVNVMGNVTNATKYAQEIGSNKVFYQTRKIDTVYYDNTRNAFLRISDSGFDPKTAEVIDIDEMWKIVNRSTGRSADSGLLIVTTDSDKAWAIIRGRLKDGDPVSELFYNISLSSSKGGKGFSYLVDEIGENINARFSVAYGEPILIKNITDKSALYGYEKAGDLLKASNEVLDSTPSLKEFREKVISNKNLNELFTVYKDENGIKTRIFIPADAKNAANSYADIINQSLKSSSLPQDSSIRAELSDLSLRLRQVDNNSFDAINKEFANFFDKGILQYDGDLNLNQSLLSDLSFRKKVLETDWRQLGRVANNDFGFEYAKDEAGNTLFGQIVLRKSGGTTREEYSDIVDKIVLQKEAPGLLKANGFEVDESSLKSIEDLTFTPKSNQITNKEIYQDVVGKYIGYDATPDSAASTLGIRATAPSERPPLPTVFVKEVNQNDVITNGLQRMKDTGVYEGYAKSYVNIDNNVSHINTTKQIIRNDENVSIVARTKYYTNEITGEPSTEYYLQRVIRGQDGSIDFQDIKTIASEDEWQKAIAEQFNTKGFDSKTFNIFYEGRGRAADFSVIPQHKNIKWTVISNDTNNMEEVLQAIKRNRVYASQTDLLNEGWTNADIERATSYNLWLTSDNEKLVLSETSGDVLNVIDYYEKVLQNDLTKSNVESRLVRIANSQVSLLDSVKQFLTANLPSNRQSFVISYLDTLITDTQRVSAQAISRLSRNPLIGEEIAEEIYVRGNNSYISLQNTLTALNREFNLTSKDISSLRNILGLNESFIAKDDYLDLWKRLDKNISFENPKGPNQEVIFFAETTSPDTMPSGIFHAKSEPNTQKIAKVIQAEIPDTPKKIVTNQVAKTANTVKNIKPVEFITSRPKVWAAGIGKIVTNIAKTFSQMFKAQETQVADKKAPVEIEIDDVSEKVPTKVEVKEPVKEEVEEKDILVSEPKKVSINIDLSNLPTVKNIGEGIKVAFDLTGKIVGNVYTYLRDAIFRKQPNEFVGDKQEVNTSDKSTKINQESEKPDEKSITEEVDKETKLVSRSLFSEEITFLQQKANSTKETQMMRDYLKNKDIFPTKVLEINGYKFYSPRYKFDSDYLESMMIVEDSLGNLYPRYFYKSQSDGTWRATSYHGGQGFSKGIGIHYTQETKPDLMLIEMLDSLEVKNVNNGIIPNLGKLDDFGYYTYDNEVIKFDDNGLLKEFQKFPPGRYNEPEIQQPKSNDLSELKYPSGFIPDFSKNPIDIKTINHTLLGNVILETYSAKLNGRFVNWVMAHDLKGRVWIEKIYLSDSKISSYGIREEVLDTGVLTNKPLEYRRQIDKSVVKEFEDYVKYHEYNYLDITLLLDNLEPIKEFRKEKNIFRKTERTAVAYSSEVSKDNLIKIYKDDKGNVVAIANNNSSNIIRVQLSGSEYLINGIYIVDKWDKFLIDGIFSYVISDNKDGTTQLNFTNGQSKYLENKDKELFKNPISLKVKEISGMVQLSENGRILAATVEEIELKDEKIKKEDEIVKEILNKPVSVEVKNGKTQLQIQIPNIKEWLNQKKTQESIKKIITPIFNFMQKKKGIIYGTLNSNLKQPIWWVTRWPFGAANSPFRQILIGYDIFRYGINTLAVKLDIQVPEAKVSTSLFEKINELFKGKTQDKTVTDIAEEEDVEVVKDEAEQVAPEEKNITERDELPFRILRGIKKAVIDYKENVVSNPKGAVKDTWNQITKPVRTVNDLIYSTLGREDKVKDKEGVKKVKEDIQKAKEIAGDPRNLLKDSFNNLKKNVKEISDLGVNLLRKKPDVKLETFVGSGTGTAYHVNKLGAKSNPTKTGEDYYGSDSSGVIAVADGVSASVASKSPEGARYVVGEMIKILKRVQDSKWNGNFNNLIKSLRSSALNTNDKMVSTFGSPSAATTFIGAAVVEDKLVIAKVGDSRIYMLRGGVVYELSEVSVGNNQLPAINRPNVFGSDSFNGALVKVYDLAPGDKIIVTSDGFEKYYKQNTLKKIKEILSKESVKESEQKFKKLVEDAEKVMGRKDDTSAVVMFYEEEVKSTASPDVNVKSQQKTKTTTANQGKILLSVLLTGTVLGVISSALFGFNMFFTPKTEIAISQPALIVYQVQEQSTNEVIPLEEIQQDSLKNEAYQSPSFIQVELFDKETIKSVNYGDSGYINSYLVVASGVNPYQKHTNHDSFYNAILNSKIDCNSQSSCKLNLQQISPVGGTPGDVGYVIRYNENYSPENIGVKLVDISDTYLAAPESAYPDAKIRLPQEVIDQIEEANKLLKESGFDYQIRVVSGYRSFEDQLVYMSKSANETSAAEAGYSPHQGGFSFDGVLVDLTNNNLGFSASKYKNVISILNSVGIVHPRPDDSQHLFALDGNTGISGYTQNLVSQGIDVNNYENTVRALLIAQQTYEFLLASNVNDYLVTTDDISDQIVEVIDNQTDTSEVTEMAFNQDQEIRTIYNQNDINWANIKIQDNVIFGNVGSGVAAVANIVNQKPSKVLELYQIGKDITYNGTEIRSHSKALLKYGYETNTGINGNGVLQEKIKIANETNDYNEVLQSLKTYIDEGWEVMLNGNFGNMGAMGHWVIVTNIDVKNNIVTVIDSNGGRVKEFKLDRNGNNPANDNFDIAPKKVLLARKVTEGSKLAYASASIIPFLNAQMFAKLSDKYIYSEWPEAKEKGLLPVMFDGMKKFIEGKINKNKIIPVTGNIISNDLATEETIESTQDVDSLVKAILTKSLDEQYYPLILEIVKGRGNEKNVDDLAFFIDTNVLDEKYHSLALDVISYRGGDLAASHLVDAVVKKVLSEQYYPLTFEIIKDKGDSITANALAIAIKDDNLDKKYHSLALEIIKNKGLDNAIYNLVSSVILDRFDDKDIPYVIGILDYYTNILGKHAVSTDDFAFAIKNHDLNKQYLPWALSQIKNYPTDKIITYLAAAISRNVNNYINEENIDLILDIIKNKGNSGAAYDLAKAIEEGNLKGKNQTKALEVMRDIPVGDNIEYISNNLSSAFRGGERYLSYLNHPLALQIINKGAGTQAALNLSTGIYSGYFNQDDSDLILEIINKNIDLEVINRLNEFLSAPFYHQFSDFHKTLIENYKDLFVLTSLSQYIADPLELNLIIKRRDLILPRLEINIKIFEEKNKIVINSVIGEIREEMKQISIDYKEVKRKLAFGEELNSDLDYQLLRLYLQEIDEDYNQSLTDIALHFSIENWQNKQQYDVLREISQQLRTVDLKPTTYNFDFDIKEARFQIPKSTEIKLKEQISTLYRIETNNNFEEFINQYKSNDVDLLIDGILEDYSSGSNDHLTQYLSTLDTANSQIVANKINGMLKANLNNEQKKANLTSIIAASKTFTEQELATLIKELFKRAKINDLVDKLLSGQISEDEMSLLINQFVEIDKHYLPDLIEEYKVVSLKKTLEAADFWKLVKQINQESSIVLSQQQKYKKGISLVLANRSLIDVWQGLISGTCFGDYPYHLSKRENIVPITMVKDGEIIGNALFIIQKNNLILIGFDPSESFVSAIDQKTLESFVEKSLVGIKYIADKNNFKLLIGNSGEVGGLSNRSGIEEFIDNNYLKDAKQINIIQEEKLQPVYGYIPKTAYVLTQETEQKLRQSMINQGNDIKFLGSGINWPESARIWREAESKAKNSVVKKIFGFSASVAEFMDNKPLEKTGVFIKHLYQSLGDKIQIIKSKQILKKQNLKLTDLNKGQIIKDGERLYKLTDEKTGMIVEVTPYVDDIIDLGTRRGSSHYVSNENYNVSVFDIDGISVSYKEEKKPNTFKYYVKTINGFIREIKPGEEIKLNNGVVLQYHSEENKIYKIKYTNSFYESRNGIFKIVYQNGKVFVESKLDIKDSSGYWMLNGKLQTKSKTLIKYGDIVMFLDGSIGRFEKHLNGYYFEFKNIYPEMNEDDQDYFEKRLNELNGPVLLNYVKTATKDNFFKKYIDKDKLDRLNLDEVGAYLSYASLSHFEIDSNLKDIAVRKAILEYIITKDQRIAEIYINYLNAIPNTYESIDRNMFRIQLLEYKNKKVGLTDIEKSYLETIKKVNNIWQLQLTNPDQIRVYIESIFPDLNPDIKKEIYYALDKVENLNYSKDEIPYLESITGNWPRIIIPVSKNIVLGDLFINALIYSIAPTEGVDEHQKMMNTFWNNVFTKYNVDRPSWFTYIPTWRGDEFSVYIQSQAIDEYRRGDAADNIYFGRELDYEVFPYVFTHENIHHIVRYYDLNHRDREKRFNSLKPEGLVFQENINVYDEITTEFFTNMVYSSDDSLSINSGYPDENTLRESAYTDGVKKLINIFKEIDIKTGKEEYSIHLFLQGLMDYNEGIIGFPLKYIFDIYTEIFSEELLLEKQLFQFTDGVLRGHEAISEAGSLDFIEYNIPSDFIIPVTGSRDFLFLGSGFNWPESARIWREAESKAKSPVIKKIFGFSASVAEFFSFFSINKFIDKENLMSVTGSATGAMLVTNIEKTVENTGLLQRIENDSKLRQDYYQNEEDSLTTSQKRRVKLENIRLLWGTVNQKILSFAPKLEGIINKPVAVDVARFFLNYEWDLDARERELARVKKLAGLYKEFIKQYDDAQVNPEAYPDLTTEDNEVFAALRVRLGEDISDASNEDIMIATASIFRSLREVQRTFGNLDNYKEFIKLSISNLNYLISNKTGWDNAVEYKTVLPVTVNYFLLGKVEEVLFGGFYRADVSFPFVTIDRSFKLPLLARVINHEIIHSNQKTKNIYYPIINFMYMKRKANKGSDFTEAVTDSLAVESIYGTNSYSKRLKGYFSAKNIIEARELLIASGLDEVLVWRSYVATALTGEFDDEVEINFYPDGEIYRTLGLRELFDKKFGEGEFNKFISDGKFNNSYGSDTWFYEPLSFSFKERLNNFMNNIKGLFQKNRDVKDELLQRARKITFNRERIIKIFEGKDKTLWIKDYLWDRIQIPNGPVGKRYTTPFAWVNSGFNSQQVHNMFFSTT